MCSLARGTLERVSVVRDAGAGILHANAASTWHAGLGNEERLVPK